MLSKAVTWAALVGLIALGGCAGFQDRSSEGSYRTIRANPARDTAAARQANRRGQEYLAEGKLDQAERAFNRALTADVEFGPAHNNLGKVYYLQKDWYKAAWEFEYAGELLPRRAGPRNNLALVLEEAGELDKAVDQYRKAVELSPGVIEYQANLARALVRRGDRTDELRSLLRTIVEEDTRPEWLLWAKRQQMILGEPMK